MNKIDEIVLNHREYVLDVIEEEGRVFLSYSHDTKYICEAKDWKSFQPVLNGLMSYAFNFGGSS